MGARERAYVPPALWHRPDFRALDREVQQLYLLLLTHPQLSLCGVIDWRPNRLAAFAADTSSEDVETAAKALVEAGLLAVDDDTEEALVRRFVRDDGLLTQPNVAKGMVRQLAELTSLHLRETFVRDLHVLREDDLRRVRDDGAVEPKGWEWVLPLLDDVVAANPSDSPGNPSGKGSQPAANPSSAITDSLLPASSSLLPAAAPALAAPAPEPLDPQQQHDPLDDLQTALDARGGHDVQWRLTDDERREVAALLERHGQRRLVEAAVAQGQPPRSAKAWLSAWRDLRPSRADAGRPTTFVPCPEHPDEHAAHCRPCDAAAVEMPDHIRQAREALRRGRRPHDVAVAVDHGGEA